MQVFWRNKQPCSSWNNSEISGDISEACWVLLGRRISCQSQISTADCHKWNLHAWLMAAWFHTVIVGTRIKASLFICTVTQAGAEELCISKHNLTCKMLCLHCLHYICGCQTVLCELGKNSQIASFHGWRYVIVLRSHYSVGGRHFCSGITVISLDFNFKTIHTEGCYMEPIKYSFNMQLVDKAENHSASNVGITVKTAAHY